MANYSNDDLDILLKANLTNEAEKLKVPPMDKQWEVFKKRYITKRNTVFNKFSKVAIAVLIIGGAALTLFGQPLQATAFGEKIINTFTSLVGITTKNKTTNSIRESENGFPQVGDIQDITKDQELSLEDIQKQVPFIIAIPKYLPPDTVKEKIILSNVNQDHFSIEIRYNQGGQLITFLQKNEFGNTSGSTLYDTDDSVTKDLVINGNAGYELTSKKGTHIITWNNRGLELQIISKLSEDELLKIAESII